MTDKELMRRALLGDQETQEECTEKRIVLPCPSCGGESRLEDMGWPHHVYCTECGMRSVSAKWGEDGEKEVIKKWNTRPAPPVGRCKDCVWSREPTEEDYKELDRDLLSYKDSLVCDFWEREVWDKDFCSYFEKGEG